MITFVIIGVLVTGVALGLLWRGAILIGDRAALDRLASRVAAEQLLQARTHATLRAMHDAVRGSWQGRYE